jgi:hypothetical protein
MTGFGGSGFIGPGLPSETGAVPVSLVLERALLLANEGFVERWNHQATRSK